MLKWTIGIVCGLLVCAAPVRADEPAPSDGDIALAQQFVQIGQGFLATRTISPAVWNEAMALFKLGTHLNPKEPRYQRLLAEAALRTSQPQIALDALRAYARLVPEDQGAQVQIIDLYTASMQSADQRLEYLTGLVDQSQLDSPVRSHAATRATRLLYDRSQSTDAEAMLAQALRLNPVNIEALRLNYDRVSETGTTYERASALLAMLRANPGQPDVMARLAGELASASLPAESIDWYQRAFATSIRVQRPLDVEVLADAAAEMLVAEQFRLADGAINALLQNDPGGADGWYLRLLMSRRTGDKRLFDADLGQATGAALERIYVAHRAFAGADPPSTQPSGELATRLPDLAADAKKLKEKGDPDLISAYAAALTDLAWLQIYFAEKPATAKGMIDALKVLLPDAIVSVPRLEGWASLLSNQPDEAKLKLSAVSERDPLAMMGLIKLNSINAEAAAKDQLQLQARSLVNDNAGGLLGAMLLDGLRDLGGKLVPSKDADVLRERLDSFPKDWLMILEKPQSFYALRAEADKVSFGFGEPIMARVTLQNVSNFDLTIGDDGVIHPGLWFDVSIKGVTSTMRSGIVFERITRAIVLRRGQSITQPVRLDSGELGQSMLRSPMFAYQLYFSVFTNPTSNPRTGVAPGAAGFRVQLKRVVDRSATPIMLQQQQQKIFETLATGTPAQKIRLISLLQAYISVMTGEKAGKDVQAKAREFAEELRTMAGDPDPAVRAWAQSIGLMLKPPDQRLQALKSLAAEDYMPARAMAVLASTELISAEEAKKFIGEISRTDPDPLVRELAAAVADDLANPTTRPTTEPSLEDALAPTTMPTTQP